MFRQRLRQLSIQCWLIGMLLLVLLLSCSTRAQSGRPRLFLRCTTDCFSTYLQQELSYFDFARDPYLADLTIVVVRQPAGNGGERFTVDLVRGEPAVAAAPSRSFVVTPGATPDISRRQLAQAVLRSLQQALAGSSDEDSFVLSLPPRDAKRLSAIHDR